MTTVSVTGAPQYERIRHPLQQRNLTVARVERLTPHMIRLTLEGEALMDFTSLAPDDHLKLIVPGIGGTPERRDFTPRDFDAEAGVLLIDVFDHPHGPAAAWARDLKPGDSAQIAGPRGSAVLVGDIAHWILIGDETALPAIGRRLEHLPDHVTVTSIVAVPGAEDEQAFATRARHCAHWIHRPIARAADPLLYLDLVDTLNLPQRTYVWIAAEGGVARALRDRFLSMGHDRLWLKSSGYWVAGKADSSIKTIDD